MQSPDDDGWCMMHDAWCMMMLWFFGWELAELGCWDRRTVRRIIFVQQLYSTTRSNYYSTYIGTPYWLRYLYEYIRRTGSSIAHQYSKRRTVVIYRTIYSTNIRISFNISNRRWWWFVLLLMMMFYVWYSYCTYSYRKYIRLVYKTNTHTRTVLV